MPQSTLTPPTDRPLAEPRVSPPAPVSAPTDDDPLQPIVAGTPLAVSLARAQAIINEIRELRLQDELSQRQPLARHD